MATFSFEDGYGPIAGGDKFVPAKRTKKQDEGLDPMEFGSDVSDKVGTLPKDQQIFGIIRAAAKKYGVPEEYAFALANQESDYNPNASNSEFGASGMFQYIPAKAQELGINPLNPEQSADAAMKEFARRMANGGPDEAIMAHFAGDGGGNRGPNTRRYLSDVRKRAADIRRQLASLGQASGGEVTETTGETGRQTFSFEEGYGPSVAQTAKPAKQEAGFGATADGVYEFIGNTTGAIVDASKHTWEYVRDRIATDMGMIAADDPRYRPGDNIDPKDDPFAEVRDINARKRRRLEAAAHEAPPEGFMDNVENIGKLLTEDSLPANFMEALANSPEHKRKAFWDARKVAMQENIVAHPDQFPTVAVEAAQQAIDLRRKKQDPSVRQMWDNLRQAAKEDPGRFAAQLVNAIAADPEMIAVPAGVGLKPIAGTKKLISGAEAVSRIAKVADNVIDAGSTGAALNMGMEVANASSEGRKVTGSELAFAGGTGFAIGGPLGAIFAKGTKARVQLAEGNVTAETLETAMRDAAREDVAVDDLINHPQSMDMSTRDRIEEMLGIKHMSETEKRAWHRKRQQELSKTFSDQSQEADYQRFKAEERIARTEQLAREAAERQEAEAAEAAKVSSVEAAYSEARADRTARFQQEYDAALQARETAALNEAHGAAQVEDNLRAATQKLDEHEIIDAAFSSTSEVRNAMLRAAQRDSKLAVPKWQRGEIDPRLLARLGIGSLFAGTAYAIAPEDKRGAAAFAAGMAGLLLPGGGSVLDRLRQSGVVSTEGDIIGLLVKDGKLKVKLEGEELRAKEQQLIARAKQGDQQAFADLYKENFPRVTRMVRQFVREAGPKLGVDAEDVAQEVFVDAFKNLDGFKGDSQFYTWLHAIARNKGLEAIRKAGNQKGGGQYKIGSMHAASGADAPGDLGAGHLEGTNSAIKSEVEAAAIDLDTPEGRLIAQQTREQLANLIQKLPPKQQDAFLLSRVENMTAQEIAEKLGENLSTILMRIKTADDFIQRGLAKDMGATRIEARAETQALSTGDGPAVVKRGRGRPRKQAGEVDPRLLMTITGVAGTAGLAAYLVNDAGGKRSKPIAALGGAALGLLLFGGGAKGLRAASNMVDNVAGVASTRLLNASPKIFRRAMNAERVILQTTHDHLAKVDPFLVRLRKMPEETQSIVARALMTGHSGVITRILDAIGDVELSAGYKNVRSVLDSIGDQLEALKRFKKGAFEYFPRIVKDKEGLFKAIGKQEAQNLQGILKDANAESIRKNGRPLTQTEESAIINQALFADKRATQPGWSKNRGIDEITPELLPFYATPAESLHSYIRSAVQDIEKAKFFGRYARNMKKGNFEFLDTERSVDVLISEELKTGELTDDQAHEIAEILKARFGPGEKVEPEFIRNLKNIGNMGLLGNLWSAANQLADVAVQVHVQGLTPVMKSVVRQLTGKKILDLKDFGLVDHISEEFANQLRTSKWVRNWFHISGFSLMDQFGKNTALNAAIIKGSALAQSEGGIHKLTSRYGEIFGSDMSALISDLKAGKVTDLTKEYAWAQLSRTQPVSRMEMPTAYLNNPKLRTFWWLKSFTVKQLDLIRRDAYNEIKKGGSANIARGLKNLTTAGVMMGLGGAGTQAVRNWMLGNDADVDWGDVPLNMFRNLGFSQYSIDKLTGVTAEEAAEARANGDKNARAQRAKPLEGIADMIAPPYKMYQDILTGNPKSVRYLVPIVGPYMAERIRDAEAAQKEEQEGY